MARSMPRAWVTRRAGAPSSCVIRKLLSQPLRVRARALARFSRTSQRRRFVARCSQRTRRSSALVENFVGQWLHLRELRNAQPSDREFDENLREAFQQETQLLFGNVVHEDRSVLELLDADYTFLNDRLARHYGIADVRGGY